jgi:hypothetical protein
MDTVRIAKGTEELVRFFENRALKDVIDLTDLPDLI